MSLASDEIIEYHSPPFGGRSINELKSLFQNALKGRCEKAYFFGSIGKGNPSPTSDIDLIIITNSSTPFIDRPKEFDFLYEIYPKIDLLVYTPEEYEKLSKVDVGFWKSVKESLKEIL